MLDKILVLMENSNIDAIDQFADRLGLTSILTSVGLTVQKGVVEQPWALTDYALAISCIGGVLFIIEKLFVIYIRYKESKRISKEEKQDKKSRKIPK